MTLPRQFGYGPRAKAESNGTALLLKKTLIGFFCVPSCRKGTRPPCGLACRSFLCARRTDTYRRNTDCTCTQAAGHSRLMPPRCLPWRGKRRHTHSHTAWSKGLRSLPTFSRHTQTTTIYISYLIGVPQGSTARSRYATDRRAHAVLTADLPGTASPARPLHTRLAACPAPKPPRRRTDRRQGVFRPTGSRPLPERLTSKRSTAGTPKTKAPHKAAGTRQPFPEKG